MTPQPRHAGEDLSCRVLPNMVGHHLPQHLDLLVHGGDGRDLDGGDRGERCLDRAGLPQLIGAQDPQRLLGACGRVASVRTRVRRSDGPAGQSGTGVWVGRRAHQLQRIGCIRLRKPPECSRIELAQRRPQPQHVPGAFPHRVLMGPGRHRAALSQRRVTGDRAVRCPVHAHDLGRQVPSAASDVAPEVECRCRYRTTDVGFSASTVYPAAISDATHRPHSVSIPTITCGCGSRSSPGSGRCSPIRAGRPVTPASPSGNPLRANTVPAWSTSCTSWWSSAQSSPTNTTACASSDRLSPPAPAAWRRLPAISWPNCSPTGHVIPAAVTVSPRPAGARSAARPRTVR
jgi:hypothetical protein